MSEQAKPWRQTPLSAQLFIVATAACGAGIFFYSATHWSSENVVEFVCYTALAVAASRLKVSLPGITGTMSVNFLFILLGVLELSLGETLVLGCAAFLVQCFSKSR